jgi:peptide/nickel transport system ATP-binding protein
MMRSYPHQLSGGQQQRIVIAMALLSKPALLLLDEPTTALDVTVEAGIVELVKGLGEKFGTSMIFVSHNLGLDPRDLRPDHVMYSGEAVETGNSPTCSTGCAPYTQGSVPLDPAARRRQEFAPAGLDPRQLPLPHERPKGCNFGPRCHHFVDGVCNAADIPMIPVEGHDGHDSAACASTRSTGREAPGARPSQIKPGDIGACRAAHGRPEEILRGQSAA